MKHSAEFAVLALALGSALAAPPASQPAAAAGTSFSLKQTRNANYVRSAPHEMARTLRKFGRKVPAHLARAVARRDRQLGRRQTGETVATPQPYDAMYLVNVSIGTPPQYVPLDIDTGSADLWVVGPLDGELYGQASYDESKSSTAKSTSDSWSIKYGDGSTAEGSVYTDVVAMGGVSVSPQAVEVSLTESSSFSNNKDMSGLVGFAFSSLNQVSPNPQKTWFDNAKSALAKPIFSVDLKHNAPGSYDFGFADSNSYTGPLVYTPVDNSSGFWNFTSTSYAVGGGATTDEAFSAIADTGTTLMYLPTAAVQAYYARVPGAENSSSAGGWIFPCSAANPDFSFSVNFNTFTVPAKYINYQPIDNTNCFGGIQDDSDIGFSIFGDVALKSFYVVFDSEGPQLGWAAKNTD